MKDNDPTRCIAAGYTTGWLFVFRLYIEVVSMLFMETQNADTYTLYGIKRKY